MDHYFIWIWYIILDKKGGFYLLHALDMHIFFKFLHSKLFILHKKTCYLEQVFKCKSYFIYNLFSGK